MIEQLNELLTLLSELDINKYTVIFAVIIVVGILIQKFLDDRNFKQYYDSMLEEKIEKLNDWLMIIEDIEMYT